MAYIYAVDLWCDTCGEQICEDLKAKGQAPDDFDERTYDSGEYPKLADGDCESDCPQHCGSHDDCLEAIELTDGSKVGALLGTTLTPDGVEYVREAIAEGGLVAELWADEFSDYF